MLSEKLIERNRKWLEDERTRLQGELLHYAGPMIDEHERPGYGTHMADSASEVFEQTKNLAVRQRLRQTLELIIRALDKIDRGTYGICENCGEAIDPARLKALPYATLCMLCQKHTERGTSFR